MAGSKPKRDARPADGIWPLVDAASMRELDRHTIETLGVAGEVLMESAGRAIAERVLANLPRTGAFEVVAVCGAGNNGGDGFVAARHLHVLGLPVRVVLIGDPARVKGDAGANLQRIQALGVDVERGDWSAPQAGIVIDAIFGTGLQRDVTGEYAVAIERIAEARARGAVVVAADLPSGLDADTGASLGSTVVADETVTMGLPKIGLALEPGRSLAGRVHVARIGIVDDAPGVTHRAASWTDRAAARVLPARPSAGHKGTFGHVLVIAGSEGKTGAAALAAQGAMRAGAGLVTVACPSSANPVLEVKTTEAMTVPVPETDERSFAYAALEPLVALAAARDVVVLGPGVGMEGETPALMRELAIRIAKPLVMDADALNALSSQPGFLAELKNREAGTILTPHPGEAGRLLSSSAADVNRDRVGAARALADASRSVVVLKGSATVIAEPSGRVVVNPTGGPALATGGTGDVLAGVTGAFVSQGLEPWPAATIAAYVHGAAADRITLRRGSSGLAAHELADEIPVTCEALRAAASGEPTESGAGERGAGDGLGLLLPF